MTKSIKLEIYMKNQTFCELIVLKAIFCIKIKKNVKKIRFEKTSSNTDGH